MNSNNTSILILTAVTVATVSVNKIKINVGKHKTINSNEIDPKENE